MAAEMGEAIAEIGGDGFVITEWLTQRTIGEITGSVRKVLQKAAEADGHGMRVMRNHRILWRGCTA